MDSVAILIVIIVFIIFVLFGRMSILLSRIKRLERTVRRLQKEAGGQAGDEVPVPVGQASPVPLPRVQPAPIKEPPAPSRTREEWETLVGGQLTYENAGGTDNRDLYIVVSHAGHELNDIVDLWFFDSYVGAGNISWGNPVTAGDYFIDGTGYVSTYRNLGTSSQTALGVLTSTFSDWTSTMRGRGVSQMSELFPFTAVKKKKGFRRN